MLYFLILIFALCWTWLLLDLRSTPLHRYEPRKHRRNTSINLTHLRMIEKDIDSEIQELVSYDELPEKKLEVA
ncbi:MAG: hypothetical protein ACM34K_13670 [Bacillota bacterium]